VSKSCV